MMDLKTAEAERKRIEDWARANPGLVMCEIAFRMCADFRTRDEQLVQADAVEAWDEGYDTPGVTGAQIEEWRQAKIARHQTRLLAAKEWR